MQILVVVATNQMRTLMTDEEKGSMRTSFGHGLVGPKGWIHFRYSGFATNPERVSG